MMKECIIPYDAIADCLGINGIRKLNEFVKMHLKEEGELACFDIDHKGQYELDGLATIANTLMPGLLPSCALMYEEGCSFIRSQLYAKFVMVSPLSVIR